MTSELLPIKEMTEWQTCFLPGIALTPEDARLVKQLNQKRQIEIDELRTGLRIRARSWVGVIRLASFELKIIPKLAGDYLGLVEMLAFTSGIGALRRNLADRYLHVAQDGHLLDLLALLLAEACERVVRNGLLYDYVEQESDLPVLRGRLLTRRQVERRWGRVDRLECRYDEHLSDIIENQILAAALAVCRRRVLHPVVRLRIHRLHGLFEEACSIASLNLKAARTTLVYNRLNQHYEKAHQLAWLLLDGLSIDDLLTTGRTHSFAFLLDMNLLFQNFVHRWLLHILPKDHYCLSDQQCNRSVIYDAAKNSPYTAIIPDIVIETRPARSKFVIDAKYKTYDDKRLNPADIYQSFLYAYAYQTPAMIIPRAMLIYPASHPTSTPVRLNIRQGSSLQNKAAIEAQGIHIPTILKEIQAGSNGVEAEKVLARIDYAVSIPSV